jgi:hypothetical protein
LYWSYKDLKRPRIKIDDANFTEGLKNEKEGLCFIYIHYFQEESDEFSSPPLTLTLTRENLIKHTIATSNMAPRKLDVDQSSKSSVASEDSKASLKMKEAESFTCRLCYFQGRKHDTQASHIFELQEYNAIDKEFRKGYITSKFGLDFVNHKSNLICLCMVCHRHFDNQLIKLHPTRLDWEVNEEIFSKRSEAGTCYASLNGTKCRTKVALNYHALLHRYLRTSKDVDTGGLMSDLINFGLVEKFDKVTQL